MKRFPSLSAVFSSLFKSPATPPPHHRPHKSPMGMNESSSDYVPHHNPTWFGY
jgi:hypothetical protein